MSDLDLRLTELLTASADDQPLRPAPPWPALVQRRRRRTAVRAGAALTAVLVAGTALAARQLPGPPTDTAVVTAAPIASPSAAADAPAPTTPSAVPAPLPRAAPMQLLFVRADLPSDCLALPGIAERPDLSGAGILAVSVDGPLEGPIQCLPPGAYIGAISPDEPIPSDCGFLPPGPTGPGLQEFLGLGIAAADEVAERQGLSRRVTEAQGICFGLFATFVPTRVNIGLRHGVVVSAFLG